MGERKKFDKAFKEQVVLRVLSGETTVSKMTEELDVHYSTVRDWVKYYKRDGSDAFPGSGNLKPEDEEMRRLRRELAEKQAIGRTGAKEGLIVHSDRVVQYASTEYQNLLKKHGFICSMSRIGNRYNNAPMESFWGKLKMEWLNDYTFNTREEAKKAVFEYIELFYNRHRTHSANGYMTPFSMNGAA